MSSQGRNVFIAVDIVDSAFRMTAEISIEKRLQGADDQDRTGVVNDDGAGGRCAVKVEILGFRVIRSFLFFSGYNPAMEMVLHFEEELVGIDLEQKTMDRVEDQTFVVEIDHFDQAETGWMVVQRRGIGGLQFKVLPDCFGRSQRMVTVADGKQKRCFLGRIWPW